MLDREKALGTQAAEKRKKANEATNLLLHQLFKEEAVFKAEQPILRDQEEAKYIAWEEEKKISESEVLLKKKELEEALMKEKE